MVSRFPNAAGRETKVYLSHMQLEGRRARSRGREKSERREGTGGEWKRRERGHYA